ANRGTDRSVMDGIFRASAIQQIEEHVEKLPRVIIARFGRAFGIYRPGHTVGLVANWQGTSAWPVWSWVVSFWFLGALAAFGGVAALRDGVLIAPLPVPILVSSGVIAVFYGEPGYH